MDLSILFKLLIILFLIVCNSLFSGAWFFQRKQTMLVDAISHAVLPVLVLTFLIVSNLHSVWFFFISLVFSVLLAYIISILSKANLNNAQQMIGVFFSGLFAVGIIMVNLFAKNIHLDTDSVLFGALEFSVFEKLVLFGLDLGPFAIYKLLILLVLNFVFYRFYQRVFTLLAFDLELAKLKGLHVRVIDLLQLSLMTLNVLFAFEIVGVFLTLGLNIIPLMIARYYSYDLLEMCNVAFGICVCVLLPVSILAYIFSVSISASFVLSLFLTLIAHVLFKKTVNNT